MKELKRRRFIKAFSLMTIFSLAGLSKVYSTLSGDQNSNDDDPEYRLEPHHALYSLGSYGNGEEL